MGLPSGVLWAPCNIDVSQPNGFAKSAFQYDCSFFSWGNVDGHNPTSPSSFSPWDWGASNAQAPWYEGQVYGNTPGATLTSNIPVGEEFDAARANLGLPWRMPTSEEFAELFEYSIYIDQFGNEIPNDQAEKRVTVNGTLGLYLQSTVNGARLFFPCCGFGQLTALYNRGVYGYYWSTGYFNERSSLGLYALVDNVIINSQLYRSRGLNIRPVMEL